MNDLLRETLAGRARTLELPEMDLDALVRRGERRLRRRRLALVAGTALLVALVIAVPSLVADLRETPRSAGRPGPVSPTGSPGPDARSGSRPLVWAEGSMLHVGERQLDIGFTPAGWNHDDSGWSKDSLEVLRATDDGAMFATLDGRIFFSDGRSIVRVGTMPRPRIRPRSVVYPFGRPDSWIWTDSAGSRAVWMEDPLTTRPVIVVYDTAHRRARRLPVRLPSGHEITGETELLGDHLYWEHHQVGINSFGPMRRTSLSSGRSEPTDANTRAADRARLTPALLVGDRRVTERDAPWFVFRDSRLRGLAASMKDRFAEGLLPIIEPATGRELVFRAPEDLQDVGDLTLFSWLDEDRFTLSATPDWDAERRDIVVCRVSAGRCDIAVRNGKGPWLVLPWAGMPG